MTADILTILDRLIAFPTLSRQSNLDLLDHVEGLLRPAEARLERFTTDDGTRANLWASLGPEGSGGVVLSGHSDVVPVEGQAWTRDPFTLHHDQGRLYGCGTADMRGFLAVAIRTMLNVALSLRPERRALCIIGEPTGMHLATGHKGKRGLRACCHDQEGHSALAPDALNALHLGAAFNQRLQALQDDLRATGARDDPDHILATIKGEAEAIAAPHCNRFPDARIEIEDISGYPGLETPADTPAVDLLRGLLGNDEVIKVAFGTGGGLFQEALDVPALVCGPGHMAQGHKPDEFVTKAQLEECAQFLTALTGLLKTGEATALSAPD